MKYKMFAVAALTVTALSADVKAACPWCESAFTGEICLNKQITTKLDPSYWACRAFIKSIQLVCGAIVCPVSTNSAKLMMNQQACTPGEDVAKCEAALNQDLATGESTVSSSISTALEAAKKDLQSEIDTVAENEHNQKSSTKK